MRLALVIMAAALLVGSASAQITTAVCAVDVTNRVISEADALPHGLWASTIGAWYPFAGTSTNADFGIGDAGPRRAALIQTNVTWRPTWTNGAMSFDGTDDRLQASAPKTNMLYGYRAWFYLTNTMTATSATRVIIGDRNAASTGNLSLLVCGPFTGALTGETIGLAASQLDSRFVGSTQNLSAGWHHVVGAFAATNWDLWVDGQLRNDARGASPTGSPGVTNRGIYSVGMDPRETFFFAGLLDDVTVLTGTWSAATITADYTNGLRRRGL